MRYLACLGSVLIHVLALYFFFFGGWYSGESMHIEMRPEAYKVDLVSVAKTPEKKGEQKAKGAKEKKVSSKSAGDKKIQEKKEPSPPSSPQKSVEESPPREISPKKEKKAKKKEKDSSKEEKREEPEKSEDEIRRTALSSVRESIRRDLGEEREKTLARALAGVKAEVASRTKGTDSRGARGADPLAVYVSLVGRKIKDNWRYPAVGLDKGLEARVRIELNKEGEILDWEIVDSSGEKGFDNSVLRAVQETGKLPSPPRKGMKKIIVNFNLRENN